MESFLIFSVLAEHDWRFSVVESDNSSIPNNSPKSKPLIDATMELLLYYVCLLWGQPIGGLHFWVNWVKVELLSPLSTLNLQSLQIFLINPLL